MITEPEAAALMTLLTVQNRGLKVCHLPISPITLDSPDVQR
jgi:hypothetical protein